MGQQVDVREYERGGKEGRMVRVKWKRRRSVMGKLNKHPSYRKRNIGYVYCLCYVIQKANFSMFRTKDRKVKIDYFSEVGRSDSLENFSRQGVWVGEGRPSSRGERAWEGKLGRIQRKKGLTSQGGTLKRERVVSTNKVERERILVGKPMGSLSWGSFERGLVLGKLRRENGELAER